PRTALCVFSSRGSFCVLRVEVKFGEAMAPAAAAVLARALGHRRMAGYHIGIDIGGTFTDCFVTDGTRSWSAKAPTTPAALDRGLLDSLRQAAAATGLSLEALLRETVHFGLGTTSVTNVLAEQRGARTGLVTTRGFADLFTIARGHR